MLVGWWAGGLVSWWAGGDICGRLTGVMAAGSTHSPLSKFGTRYGFAPDMVSGSSVANEERGSVDAEDACRLQIVAGVVVAAAAAAVVVVMVMVRRRRWWWYWWC